ncbi:bifunctional nuclease family protein [Aceticella autotrophica]|uniref:Bifunctional nuclease family protein n=1 Tax=Aceticella autotrophica TaxID=2755338 RepID=A0A975AWX6_9THEO|nr:bifunctional nuclease family protein [Aceticella autotrophica]QSZ27997.1 bifunctional nuclease family protein [Aceticella autotrophica]
MIKFKVKTIVTDNTGEFSVLLVDEEEKKTLPIAIGALEAQNIAIPIQGVNPPRPLTHDLLKSAIEALGGKIEEIVITDLKDNTYYAEIHIKQDGRLITLDARPSDAIALAVRCDMPIYIDIKLTEFTYDVS